MGLHRLSRAARSVLSLNRSREVAVLTRLMNLGPQHRLLDVGCGDGYWTSRFAHKAREVVGLDPDDGMLMTARRLHAGSNITYQEGMAEKLPFGDAEFDRVVAVSVVEHLSNPQEGLREMVRVMRPSGWLAISVDSLIPTNSSAGFQEWHAKRHHVTSYFDLDQIQGLLSACKLRPDPSTVEGIYSSRFAGAVRRLYLRHVLGYVPLFPVLLAVCRLADLLGLGGRMPAQILILRAQKPSVDENTDRVASSSQPSTS